MTKHQPEKLVAAIAAWMRFERLCSPHVRWHWERVVHEPLCRYLTGNGYPYVLGEQTSSLEKARQGMVRFDYLYTDRKDRRVGLIEVKLSTKYWPEIVEDIAKLRALGDSPGKYLLLLGPGQPDKKRLSKMLSFDITSPSIGVSAKIDVGANTKVWQIYHAAWTDYWEKRKDQRRGRGHTPNFTTTLEGITSEKGTFFVAMWRIASSVGRRASPKQSQTPVPPASGSEQ